MQTHKLRWLVGRQFRLEKCNIVIVPERKVPKLSIYTFCLALYHAIKLLVFVSCFIRHFFLLDLVSSSFRYGICLYDSLTFSPSYRINKIQNIQLPRLLSLHSIYLDVCFSLFLCLSFMFLYFAVGFSLSSFVSRPLNLFTLFFYFWRWIFNAALIPSSVSLSIDCSRYFQVKSGSRYTSTSFEKVNERTALQFNNDFWQTKCQWIFEVLTIMHFGCFYHGGICTVYTGVWGMLLFNNDNFTFATKTIDILHDISFHSVPFQFVEIFLLCLFYQGVVVMMILAVWSSSPDRCDKSSSHT